VLQPSNHRNLNMQLTCHILQGAMFAFYAKNGLFGMLLRGIKMAGCKASLLCRIAA